MMKIIKILLVTLMFSTTSFTQNDSTSLVIGVEYGGIIDPLNSQFGHGYNSSYGISLEYPVNKFSVGLAGLRKNYGEIYMINYTGESVIEIVDEEPIEYYYYNGGLLTFDYLVLSTRLIYRLNCNCAYIYGAANAEFLNRYNYLNYNNATTASKTKIPPKEVIGRTGMKKVNSSFEIGVGLKSHFSEKFRLNVRISYGITKQPSLIRRDDFIGDFNYLQVSLGFQYALKKK